MRDDEREAPSELQGVRYGDLTEKSPMAHALGRRLAARGLVAYAIIDSGKTKGRSDSLEKRGARRSRTRLRSAKLLDLGDRFLCECVIRDRSPTGLRLVLHRNLPTPSHLKLCDDENHEVAFVRVAWRRGMQIGVRITGRDESAWSRPGVRAVLRGRYYAIPD